MSKLLIPFDTKRHHIYVEFEIIDHKGIIRNGVGILDTGAPRTEFSDLFLSHAEMFDMHQSEIDLPLGQQSKKYNRVVLPLVSICGYQFQNTEFVVSRFEKSWGIDALIGLDLFRKSRITIDYQSSLIIAESF
jgi:hypothetical protein